jgi:two-component system, chemotaxis family, response regulator Rcp1
MDVSGSNSDEGLLSDSPSLNEERADSNSHILIVEDNPADVFLIRETISSTRIEASVHVVKDGEAATLFFDEADRDDSAPRPALVILDLNLPKKNGIQVLHHMRQSRRSRRASVIVVSTSSLPKDREAVILSGANAYFRKPSEYDRFLELGGLIQEWFRKASQP